MFNVNGLSQFHAAPIGFVDRRDRMDGGHIGHLGDCGARPCTVAFLEHGSGAADKLMRARELGSSVIIPSPGDVRVSAARFRSACSRSAFALSRFRISPRKIRLCARVAGCEFCVQLAQFLFGLGQGQHIFFVFDRRDNVPRARIELCPLQIRIARS